MLRMWGGRKLNRGGSGPPTPVPAPSDARVDADARPHPELSEAAETAVAAAMAAYPGAAPKPRRRVTKTRIALAVVLVLGLGMGAAYSQKDRYSDHAAELSRKVIGDKNTSRLEGYYFDLQDRMDKLKFKVFGGSTNPFDEERVYVQLAEIPEPRNVFIDLNRKTPVDQLAIPPLFRVRPLEFPKVTLLREKPEEGEGVWTTVGLPRTRQDEPLMGKTFVRPDTSRPYALVGLLLLDSRRIKLHMMGGTKDPGGDRGVKGPGAISEADLSKLLVAFTGGFQGPHGGFGMVAQGKEYRPLRKGLASIAVLADGTIKLGEWGRTLSWDERMVGVRQNAILLVEDCEVSKRTAEGNDTWGYVVANSAEFITWRSAVGLTKDGHLMLAAGNSLSAATLATALKAAGACTAMQLDINTPYVLTSLFFPQPDGSLKAEKFMESMPANPGRYLGTQERDFFYVTLDESRYR
jgi:Phosphodiester glycosidase